jgi:hypothetical protein
MCRARTRAMRLVGWLAICVTSSGAFAAPERRDPSVRAQVREAVEVRERLWSPPPRDLTKPVTIELSVVRNGRLRPGPAFVIVTFGERSLRLTVTNGKFQAPPEVFNQSGVVVEMDLDDTHIRISDEPGWVFTVESWTLRIAERFDSVYYNFPGPRNAVSIPESCLLGLESLYLEPGRERFVRNCRSKLK